MHDRRPDLDRQMLLESAINGRDADRAMIVATQIPTYYLWGLLTPLIVLLVRRAPLRRASGIMIARSCGHTFCSTP